MADLDWGEVSPESYNVLTNKATHIFNHDISTEEKIDRTIRFIVGRLTYYDFHLPQKSSHSVIFDGRGQNLSIKGCEFIKEQIRAIYQGTKSLEIEIKM